MKLAFLGKGGSGKSTLASSAVRYLRGAGYQLLAIDADHNMDLSYSFGAAGLGPFLGSEPQLIKRHLGVADEASFAEALARGRDTNISFSFDPADSFTASISTRLDDGLTLITAGPHTDAVRFGGDCSHSLSAPLKAYLPLLTLAATQAVIVDERAGTDPVATGILKGIDRAVIVVEPTIQSIRVACQLSEELRIAEVRYVFVANKVADEDEAMYEGLPSVPVSRVPFSRDQAVIGKAMERLFSSV
jgi:CO dehydrogenase maturation factor